MSTSESLLATLVVVKWLHRLPHMLLREALSLLDCHTQFGGGAVCTYTMSQHDT